MKKSDGWVGLPFKMAYREGRMGIGKWKTLEKVFFFPFRKLEATGQDKVARAA